MAEEASYRLAANLNLDRFQSIEEVKLSAARDNL
jgi:hypothetical protein